MAGTTNHPYYPKDLKIPNYTPNESSVVELLGIFFVIVAIVLAATWIYSGSKQHLQGKYLTRIKICWFVVCALIHGVLEAYFAVKHKTLAGEQSYLAQMCKLNKSNMVLLIYKKDNTILVLIINTLFLIIKVCYHDCQ